MIIMIELEEEEDGMPNNTVEVIIEKTVQVRGQSN